MAAGKIIRSVRRARMIRIERLPFIIVITFVIVIIVIIFNINKTKIRGKPNRCFVNLVKNNPNETSFVFAQKFTCYEEVRC